MLPYWISTITCITTTTATQKLTTATQQQQQLSTKSNYLQRIINYRLTGMSLYPWQPSISIISGCGSTVPSVRDGTDSYVYVLGRPIAIIEWL